MTTETKGQQQQDKTVKALSTRGREAVAELCALRDRVAEVEGREVSDTEFARRFLPYSETTWLRLRENTYTGATAEMERRSVECIAKIEHWLSRRRRHDGPAFHRTEAVDAVCEAVHQAKTDARTANRLVIYLATTGGGKTELCRHLGRIYGAVQVEGRESWRASYTAGCKDVAIAFGVDPAKARMRNSREAEERMLQCLGDRYGVLCIDEANAWGPQTANMVKMILNQTHWTVFVCAIPELWSRLTDGAWWESSQLVRRAVAVIRKEAITIKEARLFLEPVVRNKELLGAASRELAAAASAFGMFDTCQRVQARLVEEFDAQHEPTLVDVQKAIAYVRSTSAAGAGGHR